MKNTIFSKLKQAFSALGLGDEILMARAETLAALGLVTSENVDAVVEHQRKELETLQRANDRRVTDALDKERKKAEESARKAADAAAIEKAEKERLEKEAEEKARKEKADADLQAELEKQKADAAAKAAADLEAELASLKEKGVSDNVIAFLKEMREKAAADHSGAEESAKKQADEYRAQIAKVNDDAAAFKAELLKTIDTLRKQNDEINAVCNSLKQENEKAKADAAKAQREQFIATKAKELGIPQWRIDEGFNFGEQPDEAAIVERLTQTATNIKTSLMPGKAVSAFPTTDSQPSAEDLASLAKSIVK